jgi:hypothetical protein
MKYLLFYPFLLYCTLVFPYDNLVDIPIVRDIDPIEHKVNALKWCESSNNSQAVHRNDGKDGQTSWGKYQMKQKTFDWLGERYGLPHTNIHLEYQTRPIVYQALKEGRYYLWETCSYKLGFIK